MVSFAGYEMPVQYAGITEEHEAVRSSAGVFDVCHMSRVPCLRIRGVRLPAGTAHQRPLARIAEVGSAQYTLMCDEDGGIIDDLIVYHTGDLEYLIIANAANRQTDLDWLHAHCPPDVTLAEQMSWWSTGRGCGIVELVDESDHTGLIAVQGPKALGIIARAGRLRPSRLRGAIPYRRGTSGHRGLRCCSPEPGYTGEDGVEIICHVDSRRCYLAGMLLSFPEATPCGLGSARHAATRDGLSPLRQRHGQGRRSDLGRDSAGSCRRRAPHFVGSDAIARIRSEGPRSRLVGIVVEEGIPRAGFPVLHDGEEVGKVASGTFSPTLGTGIATAYLPVSLAEPGTALEVVIRRKTARARVERPPFVKSTSLS
jgi:aminomethyltransferase